MLRFLFPGLTADPERGAAAFAAVTRAARQPHWYVQGGIPDDLDGRFRVLATLAALVTVRLDALDAQRESVTLTERFIEVMESEHRELGLGDPTLGKTVRRLVGLLGRRVELWRAATAGDAVWTEPTQTSLYQGETPPAALAHSAHSLRQFWDRLAATEVGAITEGRFE